ncbi:lipid asymmetry maintenance protein MlaB [Azonexus sp. R2A61]|uniref:STAS domain-containing protein n=1 Tax=Azonexus sp. R2A61 TaxID=2744443 RepID=UPI001F280B17|nr:STAS domain-containing protein [Azonexus sp. R2A61]
MIETVDGGLRVTVPMVTGNARRLQEAGAAVIVGQPLLVDLSAVPTADSSAIAVMLAWLRTARSLRSTLRFTGIPAAVLSLAKLYGVYDLLPQA